MTGLIASNANMATALVRHLCESTVFAGIAWLVTLLLRRYPARVRFSVWMVASLKFLLPFALLTGVGAHWAKPNIQPHVRVAVYTLIEEVSHPFTLDRKPEAGQSLLEHPANKSAAGLMFLAALWMGGSLVMMLRWSVQWMNARRVVSDTVPANEGREARALRRVKAAAQVKKSIPIALTIKAMEPGVFGLLRPVLLWPDRLSEQLDDLEIEAILAHELEHVRRWDNLAAAVHSLVKALFWFHPVVHWMGREMSEERERACDERVVEQSAQPEKYAQSILTVCAFCLESPLPCVAGVSGSDLKKRIVRIMDHRSDVALTIGRRILLGAAAALVLALPVGFGVVRGQESPAQHGPTSEGPRDLPKYDVSSVKPASGDDGRSMLQFTPDGTSIHGVPLRMLFRVAFGVEADRILGAPSWAQSNRYDIEAKVAPEDAPKLDKLKAEDRSAMLIPLLVERFNMKYHHETRELPMYTLIVAKGGPKLVASKGDAASAPKDVNGGAPSSHGIDTRGMMKMMPGHIESQGTTLDMLAHSLSSQLGHTVIDKTGLTGKYDYTLEWTPDDTAGPMAGGPGGGGGPGHEESAVQAGGPSLFTAIEEQLGLKVESTKGSVDVIVIDHIDLPSAN